MKTPLTTLVFALLVLSGFTSCRLVSDAAGPGVPGTRAVGPASLQLSLAPTGRSVTIQPPALAAGIADHYDILLQRAGYADITSSGLSASQVGNVIALDSGDWTLTVTAYGTAGSSLPIGRSGPEVVSIGLGVLNTKTVKLAPVTSVGTGSLQVSFQWPAADVTGYTLTLEKLPSGTPVDLTSQAVVNLGAGTLNLSLSGGQAPASGSHLLKLLLKSGATTYPPILLAVQIFQNLTSTGSITLVHEDLTAAPAAPTGFAVTGFDLDGTGNPLLVLTWTDASNNETGFKALNPAGTATFSTTANTTTLTFPVTAAEASYRLQAVNVFGATEVTAAYTEPAGLSVPATLALDPASAATTLAATVTGTGTLGLANVLWWSDNPLVAAVDKFTGAVTPGGTLGSTKVWAKLGSLKAWCDVKVSLVGGLDVVSVPGPLDLSYTTDLPLSTGALTGQPTVFTVNAARNGATVTPDAYQWYLGGAALLGATGASYQVNGLAPGNYQLSCEVWTQGWWAQSLAMPFTVGATVPVSTTLTPVFVDLDLVLTGTQASLVVANSMTVLVSPVWAGTATPYVDPLVWSWKLDGIVVAATPTVTVGPGLSPGLHVLTVTAASGPLLFSQGWSFHVN